MTCRSWAEAEPSMAHRLENLTAQFVTHIKHTVGQARRRGATCMALKGRMLNESDVMDRYRDMCTRVCMCGCRHAPAPHPAHPAAQAICRRPLQPAVITCSRSLYRSRRAGVSWRRRAGTRHGCAAAHTWRCRQRPETGGRRRRRSPVPSPRSGAGWCRCWVEGRRGRGWRRRA